MRLITLIKILVLILFSGVCHAAFTTNNDAESVALGVGNAYGHTHVYYFCSGHANSAYNGNDTTGNGTLASPYASFAKAWGMFNTLVAGDAIAFCRGGLFPVPSSSSKFNDNIRYPSVITVRDYQPTTGSTELPIIITTGSAVDLFSLQNGGAGSSEGGYVFKNLDLRASVALYTGNAFYLYNEVDHITIDNIKCTNFARCVYAPVKTNPGTRIAGASYSDIVFTSNAAGVADAITCPSCPSLTNVQEGDSVTISGSISNDTNLRNRSFRVASVDNATKVITLSNGPAWKVVSESNTPNVTLAIRTGDENCDYVDVKNSIFTGHSGAAYLGSLGPESSIHDSHFVNNGAKEAILDHDVYISYSYYSDISNNTFTDTARVNGGVCAAVSVVGHGRIDHVTVTGNVIYQKNDAVSNQCFGIAFDPGYTATDEWFTNITISNNFLKSTGAVGIGCTACDAVEISGNKIVSDIPSGTFQGIFIPDKGFGADYQVEEAKTGNVIISNNSINGYGSWVSNATSQSKGIYINNDSTTDAAATISIDNNTIDGMYNCIVVTNGGGATVTQSGNTTSNCI